MTTTRTAAAASRYANRGEGEGSSDHLRRVMDDLKRLRQDPRHRGRSWRGQPVVRKPLHPALKQLIKEGRA